MSRILATTALSLFVGAAFPALAQEKAPDAEPRSYTSPTDESEPMPRVPPVTQPKPLERSRLGQPSEAAPPDRSAPPDRAVPPPKQVTAPKRATPRSVTQGRAATPRRPIVRVERQDESLATIFTRPRYDPQAPLNTMAPRGGPSASDAGTRPAATYYYAPVPPAYTAPAFDGAPCPTRSRTSLAALFACTR